jgi:membrane protease YdiL (CAAX protease family)
LIAQDPLAEELRGFRPAGLLAVVIILFTGNLTVGGMVVVPLGAALVLLWAWRSRTPWRAIGLVRPRNWFVTVAGAMALGSAFKILLKMVVMPLLGADPVNHAYHFLAGNVSMLPAAVWATLVAGFGEETVFRGYLFERGTRLLGCGAAAKTVIVLLTSVLFAFAHYSDQGLAGLEQGAIVGLVFGTVFAITGRIIPLMIAHSAFDLTALAIIYFDIESKVAHFLFR